jgi:hypothetical protein
MRDESPETPNCLVVWVVEGAGRNPKQYYLVSWFVVHRIERSPDPAFKTAACGED